VVIRHLNKAAKAKAIHRGIGSTAISGSVRSILQVGTDPNGDQDFRHIVHTKSNLERKGTSLCFSLTEEGFKWGGISEMQADALQAPENSEERTKVDEAREFIEEILLDGQITSNEFNKAYENAGISKASFERARSMLKKEGKIVCFRDKAKNGKWYWKLLQKGAENEEDEGQVIKSKVNTTTTNAEQVSNNKEVESDVVKSTTTAHAKQIKTNSEQVEANNNGVYSNLRNSIISNNQLTNEGEYALEELPF